VTTFREGTYVIVLPKGVVEVHGQVILTGGSVAVVNPQGQLVVAYGTGAWLSITPAVAE
jgi:hypothetical protein